VQGQGSLARSHSEPHFNEQIRALPHNIASAAHAGVVETADKALRSLQQHFFPELVRNTELFTELFERSARPALIRVRRHVLPTFIRNGSV